MHVCYLKTFTLRNYNPVFPRLHLEMKKHGAATIHLKVEVAFGQIRTRAEKKFDTTVFIDISLMGGGCCPNVAVFDPKHQAHSLVVIRDLHPYLGEMVGFLPHVVPEQLGWNILPGTLIPNRIPYRKAHQFSCLT